MTTEYSTSARVINAINDGEDLAAFFNDLFINRQGCSHMIGPALGILTQCFVAARDNGLPLTEGDSTLARFLSQDLGRMLFDLEKSANTNSTLCGDQLTGLIASINNARRSGYTWSLPEKSSPPPMPVTVVGMPKSTKTISVVRGASGSVVGSTQTEVFG
jgi:hypothetical protein